MKHSIAQRIRQARTQKEMDQAKLAAKLDLATRTVQRWEKGEQVPDSNYLMRVAKVTGVTPHLPPPLHEWQTKVRSEAPPGLMPPRSASFTQKEKTMFFEKLKI